MSQDQEEGRFHEVTSITGDQVGKAGIQEGSNRSGKKKSLFHQEVRNTQRQKLNLTVFKGNQKPLLQKPETQLMSSSIYYNFPKFHSKSLTLQQEKLFLFSDI